MSAPAPSDRPCFRPASELTLRLVEWLLGLELKLRQYDVGRRFCDAVVAAAGIQGLGMTPESFAQAFSVPVRFTSAKLRGH